jgi:hypothetical protein
MKKLILFFGLALLLNSCSRNDKQDEGVPYQSEVLPVDSYVMPAIYAVNTVSTITLRYKIPTTCYAYNGFYYEKNGLTRTVGIETINYNDRNCQPDGTNVYAASLNFKPIISGTYTFKFYTGKNANGVDQFATETVIVP